MATRNQTHARSSDLPPAAPPIAPENTTNAKQSQFFHEASDGTRSGQPLVSFLCSLVVHLCLLILLALMIRAPQPITWLNIDAKFVTPNEDTTLQVLDLSAAEEMPDVDKRDESVTIVDIDEMKMASLDRLSPQESTEASSTNTPESESAQGDSSEPEPVRFFGTHAYGSEFVYVLDISRSMKGARLMRAKRELVKSVRALPEDYSFHVVLFSEGTLNFGNEAALRPATIENKRLFEKWLARVPAQSGTLPGPALKIAGDLEPDHVFFLSDGDFAVRTEEDNMMKGLIELLSQPNSLGGNPFQSSRVDNHIPQSVLDAYAPEIVIHTFAYENRAGYATLKKIAEDKGGTCRFVPRLR
ncbi:MAG: hypothetical protein AAGG48_22845 [Planctomycetota bacterium]